MPSTYSPLLRIELQASGENDTNWGDKTNKNFTDVIEAAIAGMSVISMLDADYTLTVNSGQPDEARSAILWCQGTLTAQRSIIVPAASKLYVVHNGCNQDLSIRTANGAGVLVKAGTNSIVGCNGTDMFNPVSPTADGSIGPSKIDTSDAAWRLGSALGIGIAQAIVANMGVIHVNGQNGSRLTMSSAGSPRGELNANSLGVDFASAPGGRITFSTNSVTRMTIANDGTVTYSGALAIGGNVTGKNATFDNLTTTGVITAQGGFAGITGANVRSALNYTPLQQGTGPNQSATIAVKIGAASTGGNKLRAAIENTDLGHPAFENTTGIFAPVVGSAGFEWSANVPGVGFANAVMIREVNRAGAQGGNIQYAPALSLHWAGQAAASIRLRPDAIVSFVNNPGSTFEAIMAREGYFTSDVTFFYSDMRLKTVTGKVTDLRNRIRHLSTFLYTENALAKKFGYDTPGEQMGLSAQAVKAAFPWCAKLAAFDVEHVDGKPVSKSGENYLTVDYGRLSSVLFDVANEQYDRIEKLEGQVARYQTTLTEVMNRLSALEAK